MRTLFLFNLLPLIRIICLLNLLSSLPAGLTAQECTPWFPFHEGTEFDYSFYDKKDKLQTVVSYIVKEVKVSDGNYEGQITALFRDKKGKESHQIDFEVHCKDGVYRASVSNFLNPALKESFGSMEVKVTGTDLELPANLKPGTNLPDANCHMEAMVGILNIKMDMEITNRKVHGKVPVVTPVKTFDAYKITSDEYFKNPIMKRNTSTIYYYAEGFGQVRFESYDKNGELDAYMVLSRFEK